jgi:hypothetical protein
MRGPLTNTQSAGTFSLARLSLETRPMVSRLNAADPIILGGYEDADHGIA